MTFELISECANTWTQSFAIVGMVVTYLAFAALTFAIMKFIVKVKDEALLTMGALLWPIAIVIIIVDSIITYIGKALVLPLVAATKSDLAQTEQRLVDRIEESRSKSTKTSSTPINKLPFKKGDIITGHPANKDNYKILYYGCKCKVLSINEVGSMKLQLIDHSDRELKSEVGRVFTAPARNFIPYRKK